MTWENAWQENRTGWDTGQPAPALITLLERGVLPTGRALVPGVGSGYDAFALANSGRHVTALDIAPTAGERFRRLREERGLTPDQVEIEIGDFFTHTPPQPYDMIWDYTFLCAIEPKMRKSWAQQMARLLNDQGELVTLIFPVREDEGHGPPYAMSPELVSSLLEPTFEEISLAPVPNSIPPRQGKEWIARWKKS